MINFEELYAQLASSPLSYWLKSLKLQMNNWEKSQLHGNFHEWFKSVEYLPLLEPKYLDLLSCIKADNDEINHIQRQGIKNLLYNLMPWRKGPYSLYGIEIDSEWRSNWKWERLLQHISSLENKTVLDVGCGNGYYMWRMIAYNTNLVIGIDPSQLCLIQFEAIRKLLQNNRKLHILPLKLEQLPKLKAFDTVFSMGLLYHQRCPIKHIFQLKNQLKSGGELVLETLVINNSFSKDRLIPKGRYAQMNNVYFIPSTNLLKKWLEKIDFVNIRIVSSVTTTYEEQRTTEWMLHRSLNSFINTNNVAKTVEGYPSPIRAIILATKP
ncbi:tRNA 5-methoxyuridine(34)/uridine 5-oxyacetic acid(34) synthase CmoB [Pantoea sp. SoEX]|uniref:tRNA 5-methoxyuridine(34)/uridine 5-oxyacetic acid(34) synthase CmoB n=1 Tax=Pantoea sp. SoEX TaxID=2576763 RepID=UPI00135A515F|nr:tRNA 5-methoxyuridine(34)/uridine 5-oxyacetic acid(34) synthase CmoB [Pantoea sp. SoEX]MXP50907.1 tRNA 5-methoxyuridine(34)/uridine 5-oxyacetic acid(34) synthase CmoB [Pantoea sp. SoEX]